MNENKKISQLEIATESKNTDIIPIVQDGTNKQMTKELLLGDNYRKEEVDAKITGVNNTIAQVDAKFTGKADKATTLKGYGITDAYTKDEATEIFITNAVNDLANYYLKSETYSREEVNALVDTIPKFAITVVDSLPTKNISTTTIYLVKTDDEGNNIFTEYIYTNSKWEVLGSQKIDITNYYTKEEVDNLFTNLNISNYYKKSEVDTLLAKKAAKEIVVVGQENATDDTVIILDDDEINNIGTEVVNSLAGNETNRSPSVDAVNKGIEAAKTDLNKTINDTKSGLQTSINNVDAKTNSMLTGMVAGTISPRDGVTIYEGNYIILGKMLILALRMVATKDIAQYTEIAILQHGTKGLVANAYLYDKNNINCYLAKSNGGIAIYQSGGFKKGASIEYHSIHLLSS